MNKITIDRQELEMIGSWEECNQGIYCELIKFFKEQGKFDEWVGSVKMFEIMCGLPYDPNPDDVTLDVNTNEMLQIADNIAWMDLKSFQTIQDIKTPTFKHIKIGNIDYVLDDIMEIRSKPKLAIENAILMGKGDESIILPIVTATLVRPGVKQIKHETGKEYWVVDKYNPLDIADRIKIFNKHLDILSAISIMKQYFHLSDS